MDAAEVRRYICAAFAGIDAVDNDGDTFLIYDPARDLPPERQRPFATIVTGDRYDSASALDRPGAYRLNVGLTRATYTALFGAAPTGPGFDHTATDTLMPHPVYASQYWVCVVNPGPATWPRMPDLLAEAYAFAARKYANYRARQAPGPEG
jgi:hypothetical protein